MKKSLMAIGMFALALGAFALAFASPALAATCSDTDGFDVETAGSVSGTDDNGDPYMFSDYCTGNHITEYYCTVNDEPEFSIGYCDPPFYLGCGEGRCIPRFMY